MNNRIIILLTFVAGAAIGSGVTWYFLKTKYEQIANDEISEIREFYRSKKEPTNDDESEYFVDESETVTEEAFSTYNKLIQQSGYSYDEPEKKGGKSMTKKPYVISPDEFENLFGEYATISLTYYADGTITNDDEEVLSKEDIENLIGEDSLNHFGEYEEFTVFVQNDELKAAYEILLDQRRYSDVINGE